MPSSHSKARSTYPQQRQLVSALCSADYELACAATLLEKLEHPAAAEGEALFQAALAFRQKIEAEIDG